jgi:hypothetical protein
MQKLMLALMVLLVSIVSGCASSGGGASASDNGGLPEIAAYDDEAFEPLPDTVAAEL